MKRETKTYIAIGMVTIISFVFVVSFPVGSLAQSLSSIPLVVSLVAALFQIVRDEAAHQKRKLLQREQQDFSLSTGSHMASVAFDHHVDFCQAYRDEVIEGSKILFRDGPAKSAYEVSWKLNDVRTTHGLWVTKEINDKLLEFETAIRTIGVNSGTLESIPVGEKRSKIVDETFDLFSKIVDTQKEGVTDEQKEEARKISIEEILQELQNILGIRELTSLRMKVIESANKALLTTSASARRQS